MPFKPDKPLNNKSLNIHIKGFVKYLSRVAGLANSTIRHNTYNTKNFLKFCCKDKHFQIRNISGSIIYDYIFQIKKRLHPITVQDIISSLRSFIRYLQIKGLCKSILIESIPKISSRKYSKVTGLLSREEIQKFLNSFQDQTPIGLRNKAMALCLVRLGLRCIEVIRLCLEDIDWKLGVINIAKNKSRRTDRLPLLKEVGEAMAAYLKKGRPATKDRHIFVNHGTNQGASIRTEVVRRIIKIGFIKAGIPMPSKPVHILRHALAGQLIQQGVTIKEIADILRHRCLNTTMIYIKVDFPSLLEVAMPWPEVIS